MLAHATIALTLILLLGSSPVGYAESSLPSSVDAFVASSAALAKAGDELADLGRSSDRLNRIRAELTRQIKQAAPGSMLSLKELDELIVLCNPRGNAIVTSAERNYIQAVAAKINKVGAPSQIDNLSAAIGALFASQSVDVSGLPDDAALKKEQQKNLDRCSSDLKSYDEAYYGESLSSASVPGGSGIPGLSLLGPIGSLVDTITSIITPVVIEGSKLVDEAKRREAVLAFLRNKDNVKNIEISGSDLAAKISKFVLSKRRRLAGAFAEQLAVLRAKEIDISKVSECNAYVSSDPPKRAARRESGSPNDNFTVCWRAAWDQLSTLAAGAAKAADEYDQLADAGDSDNATKAFDPISKSLNAIAQSEGNLDELSAARIWNWTTRLLAFADKVTSAASAENRKKIQDAIVALSKGG